MEKEVRWIPMDGIEVRADENGEARGITGSAAVFGQTTVIRGMFEERIEPGAFDEAMKDDVRGLFNHDPNFVLGRTGAGTMALRSDKKALHYDIEELPKSRADVLEAIERGDVTGNSFSFSITRDEDEEWVDRSDEAKLPLRIIKRVGRLHDVGPVTFPAYEQTEVSARCAERAAELTKREEEAAEGPEPLDVAAERERLRLAEAENAG